MYYSKKINNLKNELQELINTFGYWSTEVKNFNSKLDYTEMNTINNLVKR
jgi:hypothetical protein